MHHGLPCLISEMKRMPVTQRRLRYKLSAFILNWTSNPYYLCNSESTSKKNIVNRDRCKQGCIHCRICQKTNPECLDWDEKKDLPRFIEKSKPAVESIKKCPKKIIIPLDFKIANDDQIEDEKDN